MSKHRDVPLVGRGWRALCSAVPLFLILATMIIVPPVAIAQETQSTGATGASGATGAVGATGATPTITSDKADYQPGALVTLTGAGWADGEDVHIVVNDTIGQTWKYQSDVVASTGGSFTDSFNLPNYFVSDYDVTASGPVSGTATTTFTDAPLKITGKQHEGQSSTGGYTSGNTNTYKEGDFINFHFTLDSNDATTGTDPSHGFLEVRFTGNDGTCLFFDGSFALGAIDIPSTAGNDSAPAIVSASGAIPTVVPIGTPVPVDFGTSGGEWVQTLEVTFSDFGVAVMNYHLRLSDQAGECNGASQHSRLNPPANAGDFTQTGQQNIPVPANQVIELPEIIVNKVIDRDGNGSFESTAAAGEYMFCLDGAVNCQNTNASGQVTFTNVTPDGAHNITEAQLVFTQGTYVFDSIIGTNCVANGTTAVATIASGTTATDAVCTFRNKANQGKIELKKHWVGTVGEVTLNIGTAAGGSQTATKDLTGVNKGDGTTGEKPVTAGNYFVSETGGLTNYSSSLACFNDNGAGGGTANDGIKNGTEPVVNPGANNSVAVAANDDIVCTFTNTRDRGKIELRKVWVGTVGEVTLNIGTAAGGSQTATKDLTGVNKGDGTTGETAVDTGTYFVSEVPNPPTANYVTTLDCFNDIGGGTGGVANDGIKNGTEPTVTAGANGSVSVTAGSDIVCTFTNTRDRGKIELRKVWVGTVGEVTLNIGTAAGGSQTATKDLTGANKGDGTTGETAVDTGTYFVSEVPNPPTANYVTTLDCFNDIGGGTGGVANDGIKNGTEPTVTAGANGSVSVTAGSDIVCTFTNTRDRGKIELRKVWVGTVGEVTLNIGTAAGGSQTATKDLTGANKGDGTTGETAVDTGTYFVSEVPNPPTANYVTTLDCFNDIGGGTGGVANDGIKNGTEPTVTAGANGSVSVTAGSDIVCTFTNTRDRGKIELRKVWVGTVGEVTLNIGTAAGGSQTATKDLTGANKGDGTTGETAVDTGTYFVSEVPNPPTANYVTTLDCFNDIGGGTGGVANDGIKNGTEPTVTAGANGSVSVTAGSDIVCTFTNTRDQGSIALTKVWVGTVGEVTLNIGTEKNGSQVDTEDLTGVNAGDGTTGANTVDTGTYFVSEDPNPITNYSTTLDCINTADGDAVVPVDADGGVAVATGDAVVCTFTNTRDEGSIELTKVWVGTVGEVTLNIGTEKNGSQVDTEDLTGVNAGDGTTGANTVDTGTYFVSEDPNPITNYSTTLDCINTADGDAVVPVDADGGVAVATGDAVVCTFTNTRDEGSIELTKVWVGTVGEVTLNIGTEKNGSQVDTEDLTGVNAGDGTTGANTVDTGTYFVSEDPNPITNYSTTLDCINTADGDAVVPVDADGGVAVATGDAVVCTFTNTRDEGSIELTKVWVGTVGEVTLNIGTEKNGSQVDTEDLTGVNAGDGTTGANTVDTGTYFVSEDPNPITNYSTTLDCINTADGDAVVPVDADGGVAVATGDAVVCTFTNTRDEGSIELTKVWVGTVGEVTLNIGTEKNGSQVDTEDLTGVNAGDGTTGANTVDTGTYFVSEDPNPITNYSTTLDCINTADGDAVVPVDADGGVAVATGDAVVCTFTNTRDEGSIELTKVWVGTVGEVTLNIGTEKNGSQVDTEDLTGVNAGDGTTGANTVDTGTYFVSEDPNPITNYSTTLDCINTADGDAVVPVDADGGVAVATGDAVVCTFTNTRDEGSIELTKVWVGTVGEVTLNIGTEKNGSQVDTEDLTGVNAGDGTTGANTVDTGTYFVSEDPNPITNYSTTLDCINTADGDAVVPVDADGGVAVATGDAVVCTFTNTRDEGSIELTKVWVGTVGEVTLNIGTEKNGSQVDTEDLTGVNAGDGTTGANTVDTGTYFVSEDPNPITNYSTTLDCINTADGDAVVPVDADGGVAVATGDAVVCTFTNTRDEGSIELTKVWVGTVGEVTLNIGTEKNGSQVDTEDLTGVNAGDGTTGANTVDTGTYFVSEDPNPITNYSTTLDCINTADGDAVVPVDADGGVAVATGDAVVCTFTNTRDEGSIELTKVWVGTVGEVTLNIGTSAGGSQTATEDLTGANKGNGTTGETAVDTGTFFVSESPNPIPGYTTTLACFNDNGAGGGTADDGIKNGTEPAVTVGANGSVSVTTGSDIVCTFTNTRDRGKIELRKVWVGIPGQTTLQIGTTAGAFDVDTQQTGPNGTGPLTTGENPVDTGTYFVSEVGGLAGYATSVACFNDIGGGTGGVANDGIRNGTEPTLAVGANGSVVVGKNADVVCTFTNTKFVHPGTIGFWKNWRNKYTPAQMTTIINYIIAHNPLVYATPDLTIGIYDAIFNYGNGTPRDQQILGQLTALKSNLAVSAMNPNPPQFNDSICTTGTVNVAGIAGATAFFGTATPTIGQVVNKIETTWNGTLDTNRNHWSFNLSNAQKQIAISTLTGINEGTIIVTTC